MRMVRLASAALFASLVLAPSSASAGFHEWEIKEVYSNVDGSIQYIELFTTLDNQQFVNTHTITVTDGTTTKVFTFPANTLAGTANKHLLLATPGFTGTPGSATPDFTLPCGPFFNQNATTISITFDGADSVMFAGATLPKDGDNSLTDANLGGVSAFASSANSPTNFAAVTGNLILTACQDAGTCSSCDDGLFCNGPETCSASACVAGVAPCAQQCIESTDTCVECIIAADCDDANPCTDDVCNGANECVRTNNTATCNDGLFCNGADTCAGGICTHAGDPCAGINCNEGPDTCASCTGAADCEDGQPCTTDTCTTGQCGRTNVADGAQCDTDTTFCNGVGSCAAGVCGAVAAPCDPVTETCEEALGTCELMTPHGDAGTGPTNPGNDDGGGCCQANTPAATASGPALVLVLGLAFGRRRRRR